MRRRMLATRGRADGAWRLARGMRGERPGRVRWGSAGRAAVVLGLLALAIAWPRLAPPPPRLPSDAGIPVAPPEARAAREGEGSAGGRTLRPERGRSGATTPEKDRSGRVERRRAAERRRRVEQRRRVERRRRAERLWGGAERRRAARRRKAEWRRAERRRGAERWQRAERGRAEARRRAQPQRPATPSQPQTPAPRRPAPATTPDFRPADPATTEFSFERG